MIIVLIVVIEELVKSKKWYRRIKKIREFIMENLIPV